MSNCPACSTNLPPEHALMCASGRCDPDEGAPRGVVGPVRTVRPAPGSPRPGADWPSVCPQCGGVEVEVCVAPRCRYPLPQAWRETPTTMIALAGARATGKSIYLAVLVKQLQHYGELTGVRVVPATARSAATYHEVYERPLYVQQATPGPTTHVSDEDSPDRDPLVYEIAPAYGGRSYLVLRDVSGEDLANPTPDVARLRYFGSADVVLFLFDPLALPDLRAQLSGLVPMQPMHGVDDPRVALENVLRLVAARRPRFGVVLSKFDVLQAVRDVRGATLARIMQHSGAAFSREPSWHRPYDDADGELLNEELRSLLRWLGAGDLVTAMDRMSGGSGAAHRFFAVSALGDAPAGQYLHDRGIVPFRCLDPVRWVLAGRGL